MSPLYAKYRTNFDEQYKVAQSPTSGYYSSNGSCAFNPAVYRQHRIVHASTFPCSVLREDQTPDRQHKVADASDFHSIGAFRVSKLTLRSQQEGV
jgi:hypothetical protein